MNHSENVIKEKYELAQRRYSKLSNNVRLTGAASSYAKHLTGASESMSISDAYHKHMRELMEAIVEAFENPLRDWPELAEIVTDEKWIEQFSGVLKRNVPTMLVSELHEILMTSMEKYPHQGTKPRMNWFINLCTEYDKSGERSEIKEHYLKIQSKEGQAASDEVAAQYFEQMYDALEEGKKEMREDEKRRLKGRKYFDKKDSGQREVNKDEQAYWKRVEAERKRLKKNNYI